MSSEAQKAIVTRFVEEMLNQGNLAAAPELFAAGFIDHDADDPHGHHSGVSGARDEVGAFLTAFPDLHVTADQLVGEDDTVVLRGRMSGTHTGPFFGMPPTGKPVDVWVWQTYRLEGNKIAEAWLHVDRLGLLQQLGAIPASQQAPA